MVLVFLSLSFSTTIQVPQILGDLPLPTYFHIPLSCWGLHDQFQHSRCQTRVLRPRQTRPRIPPPCLWASRLALSHRHHRTHLLIYLQTHSSFLVSTSVVMVTTVVIDTRVVSELPYGYKRKKYKKFATTKKTVQCQAVTIDLWNWVVYEILVPRPYNPEQETSSYMTCSHFY